MKALKDISLVMLGAGIALAYQKYKEPLMQEVEDKVHKSMKKINKTVEDMM